MLIAINEGHAVVESNHDGTVITVQVDGVKLGLDGDWYVNLISCDDRDDAPHHPLLTLIGDRKVRITIEAV